MEGIRQRTLDLMRTDPEEPLGALDQMAEDNMIGVALNVEGITLSPTLRAQQVARMAAKEAIRERKLNAKFMSTSVRKASSPVRLMKVNRDMQQQVKRSIMDRPAITQKKHYAEIDALNERAYETVRRSSLSLAAAEHHLKEAKQSVTRSRSPGPSKPSQIVIPNQAEQFCMSNTTQAGTSS